MEEDIAKFIDQCLTSQESYKKNSKFYKSLTHDDNGIELILNGILTSLNSNFPPMTKLLALRFLKEAMDGNRPLFIEAVSEYVIPYLKTIAAFRPDLKDDNRGKLLFGDGAPPDAQNIGNSILRMTLECLLSWNFQYGRKFSLAVKELLEKGVKFPDSSGYFKNLNWSEVLEASNKLIQKSNVENTLPKNKPFKKSNLNESIKENHLSNKESPQKESVEKKPNVEILNVEVVSSPKHISNKATEKKLQVNLLDARKEFLKVLIDSKKGELNVLVTRYLENVDDKLVSDQFEKYMSKSITLKEFVMNIKNSTENKVVAEEEKKIEINEKQPEKSIPFNNPLKEKLKNEYNNELKETINSNEKSPKEKEKPELNNLKVREAGISHVKKAFLALFKGPQVDINQEVHKLLISNEKKELLEYFSILTKINEIPTQDLSEENCNDLLKSSELMINYIPNVSKILDIEILRPLSFNINANPSNNSFKYLYNFLKKLAFSIPFDFDENPSVFFNSSKEIGIKKFKYNIDEDIVRGIIEKLEIDYRNLEFKNQRGEESDKIMKKLVVLKELSIEIIIQEPQYSDRLSEYIKNISKLELLPKSELKRYFSKSKEDPISFRQIFEKEIENSSTQNIRANLNIEPKNHLSVFHSKNKIEESSDDEIFWKKVEKPNLELFELQKKYDQLSKDLENLKKQFSLLKTQKEKGEKDNIELKNMKTVLEKDNYELKQELEEAQSTILSLMDEIEKLKIEIEEIKKMKPIQENVCNYTLSDDSDIYEGFEAINVNKSTKIFQASENTLNAKLNQDKIDEMLTAAKIEIVPEIPPKKRVKVELIGIEQTKKTKMLQKLLKGKGYLLQNEYLNFAFRILSVGDRVIIHLGILPKEDIQNVSINVEIKNPGIKIKAKEQIRNISVLKNIKISQTIKLEQLQAVTSNVDIALIIKGFFNKEQFNYPNQLHFPIFLFYYFEFTNSFKNWEKWSENLDNEKIFIDFQFEPKNLESLLLLLIRKYKESSFHNLKEKISAGKFILRSFIENEIFEFKFKVLENENLRISTFKSLDSQCDFIANEIIKGFRHCISI